jgi:hypothetical protein
VPVASALASSTKTTLLGKAQALLAPLFESGLIDTASFDSFTVLGFRTLVSHARMMLSFSGCFINQVPRLLTVAAPAHLWTRLLLGLSRGWFDGSPPAMSATGVKVAPSAAQAAIL